MTGIFIFLLAITAFEAFRVASEIYQGRKCPSDFQLQEFLFGRTAKDSSAGEKISRHIGSCKKCQEKLHDLTDL